jgi:NTE family protein
MKCKIVFFFFLFSLGISSQKKSPKVGLVLSGGGAKGFAHIGVLKEIDKAGLQLDYIGGTSMGAIIGGLYAVGYSGNQIEEIMLSTNFLGLLRDKLPRKAETFFEKEYGEKTFFTLPVKKGKIGLPKAISKGQNVLNFLLELFDTTKASQDFAKLPIPFFCIATDLENGAPVLLEEGSLPLALRASGSFPSLLNPVEIAGKLLTDGGIANNFPVSIMKEKGVDIVIGVNVEGKLFQKEKLNSVVALLNQIMSYSMYRKTDEEIKKLDVYIHPEIYKYTVVDFDKKAQILEKGVVAAKKFTTIFEQIAMQQVKKEPRKIKVFPADKLLISEIGVQGIQNYTRAYILGKLKTKVGDHLSRKEITAKIHSLSATRNYNRVEYYLREKVNGSYRLDFKVKESDENANLKLGVRYDLLYKSSVLATYSQKHLLKKNDLFSVDIILGDNVRYNLNYFVDNGFYISYGFRSRYNHFRSNSKFNQVSDLPNVNSINLRYSDITNQAFFQTTYSRKFALGLGLEHKWISASTATLASTTAPVTIIDENNYWSTFGYLKLDTYDKKYFPTKGYFADLNFKWYAASSSKNSEFKMFSQAHGALGFAVTFADRLTFQNTHEAGFTIENPGSNLFDFYLGGYNQNYINTFVSFYGYEFADLSNNSFIKSQFDLRYRLGVSHYFSFIANYARLEDNVFKDLQLFDNIKSGYAVGYSYNSLIGPIELKYSWTPDNKKGFWLFNLGFWF